jgi:hypothetical protein
MSQWMVTQLVAFISLEFIALQASYSLEMEKNRKHSHELEPFKCYCNMMRPCKCLPFHKVDEQWDNPRGKQMLGLL